MPDTAVFFEDQPIETEALETEVVETEALETEVVEAEPVEARPVKAKLGFYFDGRVNASLPVNFADEVGKLKFVSFSNDDTKARLELARSGEGGSGTRKGNECRYEFASRARREEGGFFKAALASLFVEGDLVVLQVDKAA